MPLTGLQFQQLQHALLSAFPTHAALAQLVKFGLNQNLDAVAGTGALNEVVFKLITWAEAEGRTAELAAGTYQTNPGNSGVRKVSKVAIFNFSAWMA